VALALIGAGAALVAGGGLEPTDLLAAAAVAAACFLWALDSNLTREIAHADALTIAGAKGWGAAAINLGIGWTLGERFGGGATVSAALAVGALSYGLSLALYVVALRDLGAARASAYFGVAPFLGAALAVPLGGEPVTAALVAAAALMAMGTWVLASEAHSHAHRHAVLEHSHAHVHDDHHRHDHAGDPAREPHEHSHRHEELVHEHPHAPDLHHRHPHR
jgi:drug/metabolite transporter (DMT)-like permease